MREHSCLISPAKQFLFHLLGNQKTKSVTTKQSSYRKAISNLSLKTTGSGKIHLLISQRCKLHKKNITLLLLAKIGKKEGVSIVSCHRLLHYNFNTATKMVVLAACRPTGMARGTCACRNYKYLDTRNSMFLPESYLQISITLEAVKLPDTS